MLCSERSVTCGMISGVKKKQPAMQSGVLRAGLVEGKSVGDILLVFSDPSPPEAGARGQVERG